MQREQTGRIECVVRILAFCFLGLALPAVSQASPTIHIVSLDDKPISSIRLEESFRIGLENMTPGQIYEIRFVDSSDEQLWGRLMVQAEVPEGGLLAVDASWGIALRRILAGCATQEELEEEGVFWEEDFRYPSFLSALQAVSGKTFLIQLYNDPSSSPSLPLTTGVLSISALDESVLISGDVGGRYKDIFLTGNGPWAKDIYATYADGSVAQNGATAMADVYVVTESDYRAGPSAWREVRSAYAGSPQQIALPQGQEVVTFKLWDASDTVAGAYRVIVLPLVSGKINVGPGIEENTTPDFILVGSDLAGPGTIAPSIWRCPSPP